MRAVHAACGDAHTLVLDAAGKLHACGQGGKGALGLGHPMDAWQPQQVPGLEGIALRQLAAGADFSVVLGSKGEVVDALVASCFIPGFMAMAPVDPVHGAVDAAFALDMDDHRRAAEMLVVSKPIGFMYSHLLFNLAAVDEAEAMGLFEQGRTAAHAHDREAWAQQLASSREGAG